MKKNLFCSMKLDQGGKIQLLNPFLLKEIVLNADIITKEYKGNSNTWNRYYIDQDIAHGYKVKDIENK